MFSQNLAARMPDKVNGGKENKSETIYLQYPSSLSKILWRTWITNIQGYEEKERSELNVILSMCHNIIYSIIYTLV